MVYKISFYMETPIITHNDIHLDAIFDCVSPAAHNKNVFVSRFSDISTLKAPPIPIDCLKIGDNLVYCCSSADYIEAVSIDDNFTKRMDQNDFLYLQNHHTPRSGIMKDYMIKVYGVLCSRVEFMVSSTSLSDLNRYCKRVSSIGSNRKQGYGKVTRYEISTDDRPWAECVIQDGKAIRNLPAAFLSTPCSSRCQCRSPYWHPDRICDCAKVGDAAQLKKEVMLSAFRRHKS